MKKMNILMAAGLIALSVPLVLRMQATKHVPATEAALAEEMPQLQSSGEDARYRLYAGAHPRFNDKQVFLPPDNSVVVTNEALQNPHLYRQASQVSTNSQ